MTIWGLYENWEDWLHGQYGHLIEEECKNFVFLKDGSIKYDFAKFDSYWDAMFDAVKEGEDIDKVVRLVFRESVDWPIVKKKILKALINYDKRRSNTTT